MEHLQRKNYELEQAYEKTGIKLTKYAASYKVEMEKLRSTHLAEITVKDQEYNELM